MPITSVDAFIQAVDDPSTVAEGPMGGPQHELEHPVQWGPPASLEAGDAAGRLGGDVDGQKTSAFLTPIGHDAMMKEAVWGKALLSGGKAALGWGAKALGKVVPAMARGAGKATKGVGKATLNTLRKGRNASINRQAGNARKVVGEDATEAAVKQQMGRKSRTAGRELMGEAALTGSIDAHTIRNYGQ